MSYLKPAILGHARTGNPPSTNTIGNWSWRRSAPQRRDYENYYQGWSGHGVAQTVRIGKAISDAIQGRNDDFDMPCRIPNVAIPFGRQLAPVAIPVGIALLDLRARLQPSKMISF